MWKTRIDGVRLKESTSYRVIGIFFSSKFFCISFQKKICSPSPHHPPPSLSDLCCQRRQGNDVNFSRYGLPGKSMLFSNSWRWGVKKESKAMIWEALIASRGVTLAQCSNLKSNSCYSSFSAWDSPVER